MSEGKKFDAGKLDISLVDPEYIKAIAEVMGHGAEKYGKYNWRKGLAWTRVYSAAQRHLLAWLGGEERDPETRCSHLAHAGCCIMFLLNYTKNRISLDDRWKEDEEKA